MKPNADTQAAVRCIAILRDIVQCYAELGPASTLQAVSVNHEEARELLEQLKGTRFRVTRGLRVR